MFMKGLAALIAILGIALISETGSVSPDSLTRLPLESATNSRIRNESPSVTVSTVCKNQMQPRFWSPERTIFTVVSEKLFCP
jgi:hypothetical protein